MACASNAGNRLAALPASDVTTLCTDHPLTHFKTCPVMTQGQCSYRSGPISRRRAAARNYFDGAVIAAAFVPSGARVRRFAQRTGSAKR